MKNYYFTIVIVVVMIIMLFTMMLLTKVPMLLRLLRPLGSRGGSGA